MAITGLHTIIYSPEADALKAMMRDVFDLPVKDEGDGFLIFDLPPATLEPHTGPPEVDLRPGSQLIHELSFMCDDLKATVEELRNKGVEFRGEPIDKGWGDIIVMVLPGGVEMVLYEPKQWDET
ncbi:MAG: hypothetical protein QF638_06505 [Acidimicrobiales bacterium]|jgi:catechol 2,3-dioxygenase-like lactoylglutathione lyase family enzyme|nr:extradiol dioxygenase [Chloroflexota bacterium]MDP6077823.1 hypothetical protein [Acidimicrobiales bacterium]HCV36756.1 extradiol dioxygenase [Acidimicrobiaceae bacterium]HJO79024.1 hypothetical protein [Acidimicrobiales bacterium]|tara:strand:+ start:5574 stop:5945 length:372 start_codon:yes stop_codon:yes gene_type:complete